MHRFVRRGAARGIGAAAAALALAAAALVAPATARALSDGCNAINDPAFDGMTQGGAVLGYPFDAGERITVSAGPPTASDTPTAVVLSVDGNVVDTAAFPGTVTYTFPAAVDGPDVEWQLNVGIATVTTSCDVAPHPATAIRALRSHVASLGIHPGIAGALDRRLVAALDALAANHTAGACAMLQAFLSHLRAPTWGLLSAADAQQLTDEANDIRTHHLGC